MAHRASVRRNGDRAARPPNAARCRASVRSRTSRSEALGVQAFAARRQDCGRDISSSACSLLRIMSSAPRRPRGRRASRRKNLRFGRGDDEAAAYAAYIASVLRHGEHRHVMRGDSSKSHGWCCAPDRRSAPPSTISTLPPPKSLARSPAFDDGSRPGYHNLHHHIGAPFVASRQANTASLLARIGIGIGAQHATATHGAHTRAIHGRVARLARVDTDAGSVKAPRAPSGSATSQKLHPRAISDVAARAAKHAGQIQRRCAAPRATGGRDPPNRVRLYRVSRPIMRADASRLWRSSRRHRLPAAGRTTDQARQWYTWH